MPRRGSSAAKRRGMSHFAGHQVTTHAQCLRHECQFKVSAYRALCASQNVGAFVPSMPHNLIVTISTLDNLNQSTTPTRSAETLFFDLGCCGDQGHGGGGLPAVHQRPSYGRRHRPPGAIPAHRRRRRRAPRRQPRAPLSDVRLPEGSRARAHQLALGPQHGMYSYVPMLPPFVVVVAQQCLGVSVLVWERNLRSRYTFKYRNCHFVFHFSWIELFPKSSS